MLGSPEDVRDVASLVRDRGRPLVVLGGERLPNAALMELSTVPIGVCAEAHRYLAEGGAENLRQLHAFLSDTVLLTGEGFEPPAVLPEWGVSERATPANAGLPRVGILYYRAHEVSGNQQFAHQLADAIDTTGRAVGVPIFVSSLRAAADDLYDELATLDAIVVTVLAAGGSKPATASAGGDDEAWDVERLRSLDVPVLQALALTSTRAEWEDSDDGVTPIDSATQIAIPEFDGRLITVPFSFKEVDDGLPHYETDPERCARVAGIAANHARLRYVPPAERKVALVLSAYPTKHSRIGNAVGLDTPVSAIRLLRQLRDAGYDLGAPGQIPGLDPLPPVEGEEPDTTSGNALIHALIEAGGQDEEWLTQAQLGSSHVRISRDDYLRWTADLPSALRDEMVETWGEAPGSLFVDDAGDIVLATLRAGNVVILIQPPARLR